MRRRDWNDKSYHMSYKEKYKMKSKTLFRLVMGVIMREGVQ